MPGVLELNSPTETVMELVQSPNSINAPSEFPNDNKSEKVKMKKQLGLLEGVGKI
jgi:hypothetical protein